MATPAITLILDEVQNRLENISIVNEYSYDAMKIERARLEPFNGYDLPAINFWGTTVGNERNAYNDDKRMLELFIEMHTLTRDEPFIDVANRLAADIITAMVRSPLAPKVSDAPNYDLNETVEDLILNGYDYTIGEGEKPFCGILVNFTLQYITSPFEMYTYTL